MVEVAAVLALLKKCVLQYGQGNTLPIATTIVKCIATNSSCLAECAALPPAAVDELAARARAAAL